MSTIFLLIVFWKFLLHLSLSKPSQSAENLFWSVHKSVWRSFHIIRWFPCKVHNVLLTGFQENLNNSSLFNFCTSKFLGGPRTYIDLVGGQSNQRILGKLCNKQCLGVETDETRATHLNEQHLIQSTTKVCGHHGIVVHTAVFNESLAGLSPPTPTSPSLSFSYNRFTNI